jgi:hypothetical protein
MDLTTVVENLLSAIETNDKDEIDEAVSLTKLILKAGAANPAPVGTWIVLADNDDIVGPFADEATAEHYGQNVYDPSGVGYRAAEIQPWQSGQSGAAAPAQALPPGYTTDPAQRIRAIPPGTLYR